MDGETTSRGGIARFVPRLWGEWARFVARPALPQARQPFGAEAVGEVGQLLALTVAIDLLLVIGLSWLATWLSVKTPEFEELRRYGPVVTILLGALALPVLEECVFRGWLTGRRWMLGAVGVLIAATLSLVAARYLGGARSSSAIAILIAWAVIGALLVWRLSAGTPPWFERAFRWLYFASALLFGLAHISNYDLGRPWVLLPFVVPQTIAGLIFGFARVRYGMWANIALHATSNALFLGLSLSGF